MTDNKLADALRIAMEWNWLDDDARPSRVAEICDDALAEHDAKAALAKQVREAVHAAIAALQQKVTPLALPEVSDEDEAEAWDVLLITTDSCAGGDMRKVLESYRARLMAKGVPNG